jgi:hypothetical protein
MGQIFFVLTAALKRRAIVLFVPLLSSVVIVTCEIKQDYRLSDQGSTPAVVTLFLQFKDCVSINPLSSCPPGESIWQLVRTLKMAIFKLAFSK